MDMCVDVCTDMCADRRIGRCMDMCADMYVALGALSMTELPPISLQGAPSSGLI